MIDPKAKTIVVLMLACTACIAVLGVIAAFIYALMFDRLTVPDVAVNGFWVAVVAILGLVSSVIVPFARDWFARTQRQLTQDKIDATQQTIETTHQAVQKLQESVENGLAANVSGQVAATAAVVAAQLAHDHPLSAPVATALDTNTAALADATSAIDANTAAVQAKDGG